MTVEKELDKHGNVKPPPEVLKKEDRIEMWTSGSRSISRKPDGRVVHSDPDRN